ncbi:hypothetical protein [Anaerofustis stercorihominis]|uniref:hypothetical protein n=1 Tax=Anaerofustis stercorihominis TaxID=214853 RepID=UPI00214C5D64|nr:hypothetical protein [Anaerofustis stercorihominis]MCR2033718.1 hypothetical protein [Anaerofustis stercorihominis]
MATIAELDIELKGSATSAAESIDSAIAYLERLKSISNIPGLSKISNDLQTISDKAKSIGSTSSLDSLANSLSNLKSVGNIKITSTVNQLKKLGNVSKDLDVVISSGFDTNILKIVSALKPLSEIGKSNLGGAVNALKKLPEVAKELRSFDLTSFAESIKQLTSALDPLATKMNSISKGFQNIPAKISNLIKNTNSYTATTKKASGASGGLFSVLSGFRGRAIALSFAVNMVGNAFGGFLNQSNEYIENLNLFSVSMGKYADSAYNYAMKVQELLGIDVSNWMENQSVFQQMATGFGIASDKAQIMSKNLTQLGYDLASYFNVPVESAMNKLQSGLSGQIKGLKAFGINVSVAAIQETALAHGVNKSTYAMSEAEKAVWRYVTIIEKSVNAQGDLARTLVTPANALRILGMQADILKRSLGNMISAIVVKFIPVIQFFVQLITMAANALAKLLGFELPKIDYSGMGSMGADLGDAADSVGDLGSGLGGATKKAKETKKEISKIKKELMGFDELNILSFNKPDKNSTPSNSAGSGGSGKGSGSGGGIGNIKLPSYDFLGNAMNQELAIITKLKKELSDLFRPFKESWNIHGKSVVYAAKSAFGTIKDVLGLVYQSFKKAWTGGSGQRILNNILVTIKNIFKFVTRLSVGFGKAWNKAGNGDRIFKSILGIIEDITFNVRKVTDRLVEWAGKVDWTPLISSMADILESVRDLHKSLSKELIKVLEDLLPVATVFVEDILPPAVKLLSDIINIASKHPKTFMAIILALKLTGKNYSILGKNGNKAGKNLTDVNKNIKTSTSDTNTTLDLTKKVLKKIIDKFPKLKELGTKAFDKVTSSVKPLKTAIKGLSLGSLGTNISAILVAAAPIASGLALLFMSGRTEAAKLHKEIEDITDRQYEARIELSHATTPEEKEALKKEIKELEKQKIELQVKYKAAKKEAHKPVEAAQKVAKQANIKLPYDVKLRNGTVGLQTDYTKNMSKVKPAKVGYKVDWSNKKDFQRGSLFDNIFKTKDKKITYTLDGRETDTFKKSKKRYDGTKSDKITKSVHADEKSSFKSAKKAYDTLKNDKATKKLSAIKNSSWNKAFGSWGWWKTAGSSNKTVTKNVKAKVPKISMKTGIATIKGITSFFPQFDTRQKYVSGYAKGGFPDMGQLFIAREAGPELVGSMGNKNVVANNVQITEGISNGVYNAVMAALGSTSSTNNNGDLGSVIINLDTKPIAEAVINFHNKQVKQYGTSPLLV